MKVGPVRNQRVDKSFVCDFFAFCKKISAEYR
jgi:hypothetical protein